MEYAITTSFTKDTHTHKKKVKGEGQSEKKLYIIFAVIVSLLAVSGFNFPSIFLFLFLLPHRNLRYVLRLKGICGPPHLYELPRVGRESGSL